MPHGKISFFDLEALRESLAGNPVYRPFSERVRRYRDVMSILNDLRESSVAIEVLATHNPLKVVNAQEALSHHVISGALLTQAVILYARATKTSSRHRGFVPVLREMPPDLKGLQSRIVTLRDDAIAHFGPGAGGNRPPWAKETTALRVKGENASLLLPYSRAAIQSDLTVDLQRLLAFAIPAAWKIADKRADSLLAEFKHLYDTDSKFAKQLKAHPLDLNAFFGGDQAAIKQVLGSHPFDKSFAPPSWWQQEFSIR